MAQSWTPEPKTDHELGVWLHTDHRQCHIHGLGNTIQEIMKHLNLSEMAIFNAMFSEKTLQDFKTDNQITDCEIESIIYSLNKFQDWCKQ